MQQYPHDITARKHGGNEESRAVNLITNKTRDRERILKLFAAAGPEGLTKNDIVRATQMLHSTVSARLSDLKAVGKIAPIKPKLRRENCAALELVKPQLDLF